MESEKVKEVKESLQQEYPTVKFLDGCMSVIVSPDLLKDCLILVNELESENEGLKKKIDCDRFRYLRDGEDKDDTIDNLREENEKLEDQITKLENEKKELAKQIVKITGCSVANEEVDYECNRRLKQFAERLKESASQCYASQNGVIIGDITYSVSGGTLDKILKESINENLCRNNRPL